MIETSPDGRVLRAHPAGQWIADSLFGEGVNVTSLTRAQLEQVAARMAQLLLEVFNGAPSQLAQRLLMTDALPACDSLYALTLSGGVGECFRTDDNSNPFRFGDIGPLLAQAIHLDAGFAALPVQVPNQTVRATVIGAGAHTLSLSGSTIWLDGLSLPIRNIPVVHPDASHATSLVEAWLQALTQMDLQPQHDLMHWRCLPSCL